MKREDVLLAILAVADGRGYQPVQMQKAMFLLQQNLSGLITEGECYYFEPYDYGPFDKQVYEDAETLSCSDLVEITKSPNGRWKTYAASALGSERGTAVLQTLPKDYQGYISAVSSWVRSLGFNELVKSIYAMYPDMKKNSVFVN